MNFLNNTTTKTITSNNGQQTPQQIKNRRNNRKFLSVHRNFSIFLSYLATVFFIEIGLYILYHNSIRIHGNQKEEQQQHHSLDEITYTCPNIRGLTYLKNEWFLGHIIFMICLTLLEFFAMKWFTERVGDNTCHELISPPPSFPSIPPTPPPPPPPSAQEQSFQEWHSLDSAYVFRQQQSYPHPLITPLPNNVDLVSTPSSEDEEMAPRLTKNASLVHHFMNSVFHFSKVAFILICISNFTIRFILYQGKMPFAYFIITPFLAMVASTTNYGHIMAVFTCILLYILFLALGLKSLVLYIANYLLSDASASSHNGLFGILSSMIIPGLLTRTDLVAIANYFAEFSTLTPGQILVGVIEVIPIYGFFLWKIYYSFTVKLESYRNEREAHRQQVLLEMLMNNMPSILWSVDQSLTVNFIRGKSMNLLNIGNTTSDQLQGMKVDEVFKDQKNGTAGSLCLQRHQMALKGETVSFPIETSQAILQAIISPWRNEHGEIIGAIGIANDVTFLVKAENALRTSEEHYRSLVESIQDLIVKIDRNYNVLFTNSRLLPFLDKSPKEYTGENILKFFESSEALKEEAHRNLKKVFEQGEPCYWEWNIVCPPRKNTSTAPSNEPNQLYFSVRVNPILKDDTVIAATLICADVTEKKKAQESLLVAEKAKIANKSKSDFLRVLSHELRNPLNSVLGALQLLSATSDLSPLQTEYIEDANESAKLLLAIIQDVLDMSKIEAGKLTLANAPFSILETVETTADMYSSNAFEKHLELITYVDSQIPVEVIGDKTRLGQVLSNLCTNSIKFTHSGYVYISAVLASETPTHATIRFSCEDTGIGIPETELPRIFKPFSQINANNNENKGWGLGLAISDRLVKLMKGKISLQSPANRFGGCLFSFTIKLAKSGHHNTKAHYNGNSGTSQSTSLELLPLEEYPSSSCPAIVESVHFSKFGNTIVMVSSDLLANTIVTYLKVLHVKNIHTISTKQQLDDLITKYMNTNRNSLSEKDGEEMRRTALIIDSRYEALVPTKFREYVLSEENTTLKLITLFGVSGSSPNIPTQVSKMNVVMRKPMKFSRLMSALSERKNSMSSLMWDINLDQRLQLNPQELGHQRSNSQEKKHSTVAESDGRSTTCNHEEDSDTGSIEILVVEDSALNRKIVTRLLNKCGVEFIDQAVNGEEAVNMVSSKDGVYDCILMDLQMPIMDGKKATELIRALPDESKRQTPIIALTANAWTNERENCLKIGMDDVITKPITLDTLVATIKKVTCKQPPSSDY